jgi:predicted nucleotidyltransferase
MTITTVKHLAREVDADERTLRRAVEQGTVRGVRRSPRRLEIANDERRYLREHWSLLQRLRGALRTEPNVRMAALFGSAARGEDRVGSDLDLLVDLHDDSWERRSRLNTRLEEVAELPVELLVLDRVRSTNASLLADAIRDGRVLVDRAGVWPALKRSERAVRRAAQEEAARHAEATQAAVAELLS